jgi:hypothetical protein
MTFCQTGLISIPQGSGGYTTGSFYSPPTTKSKVFSNFLLLMKEKGNPCRIVIITTTGNDTGNVHRAV